MWAEIAISARMRRSSATRGAGTRSSTTRTRWTQPEHATPASMQGHCAPPPALKRRALCHAARAAHARTASDAGSGRCRPVGLGNVVPEQRVRQRAAPLLRIPRETHPRTRQLHACFWRRAVSEAGACATAIPSRDRGCGARGEESSSTEKVKSEECYFVIL